MSAPSVAGLALPALERQTRCVLAARGSLAPLASPMAFWFDGSELWLTTASDSEKVRALRRDPACVAWVPPADAGGAGVPPADAGGAGVPPADAGGAGVPPADAGGAGVPPADTRPGTVVRGQVRVFSLKDPVGLATHGPVIGAAMTALAARNLGTLLGYAQDAARVPVRWAARNRVVLRLRVEDAQPVSRPQPSIGPTPPLPAVVPPDVRRALAGERRVVVASDDGALAITPAVWGQGFRLAAPDGRPLPIGVPVSVVVDTDPRARPTGVVGLALRGEIGADGAFRAARATWWQGFEIASADVPTVPTDIVLPE